MDGTTEELNFYLINLNSYSGSWLLNLRALYEALMSTKKRAEVKKKKKRTKIIYFRLIWTGKASRKACDYRWALRNI